MIKKETDLVSFFLLTQLFAKISKSRKRAKQNFQSPKKVVKNHFFEVRLSEHFKQFRVDWAILFFSKFFFENVNLDLENFCCRTSGLRNFQKNLKKIDFSILVFLDDSENLESFELYLFLQKNSIILYYYYT